MTKKIAVINDLSGFGRCSLTAAISVIASMGVQPCPLPTALLTAQTGYPSYYCDDYTDKMEIFRSEWAKMGEKFDGIYTGFVASEKQITEIFHFLDTFYKDDTFLLVDPIMGDDGIPYDFFTPTLKNRMKELAFKADVITPNPTEVSLLTDTSYDELMGIREKDVLVTHVETLGKQLCEDGPTHVVVTGLRYTDEEGIPQMGNLDVTTSSSTLISFPYIGGSYSGTGDLFAACLAGGIARGDTIPETIELAGDFLESALADSVEEGIPEIEGVNYEKYLSRLGATL